MQFTKMQTKFGNPKISSIQKYFSVENRAEISYKSKIRHWRWYIFNYWYGRSKLQDLWMGSFKSWTNYVSNVFNAYYFKHDFDENMQRILQSWSFRTRFYFRWGFGILSHWITLWSGNLIKKLTIDGATSLFITAIYDWSLLWADM